MRSINSPSALFAIGIAVLLAFAFLGSRGIWDPDEGRYTNAALNMLETGDWVHPMRNAYVGHWTKPPLTYWAIAASIGVFGSNPWAARLPCAVAYLACVWLVWRMARHLLPGRQNEAALIYATFLLPFGAVQLITTDFLLAAACSAAMACWIESRFSETTHAGRWLLGMWLCFALAFLIKGPPSLLYLLVIALCGVLVPGPRPRAAFHVSGFLLFALAALPWYAIVIRDTPGLLDYYLGVELIDRLTEPELARHGEWYGWIMIYAPTLLLGTLPWTLDLWRWLLSLGARLRGWRERQARSADAAGVILFVWVALPLLVFCLSRSRMPLYLLPLFTPLALILARQRQADGRSFPSLRVLGGWVMMLLILRAASSCWPTHKNAEAWAAEIRTHVDFPLHKVVFVEDMARYGLHLHLGVQVEKLSMQPVADRRFDPEYDGNFDARLEANPLATLFVCKSERWSEVQAEFGRRGYQTQTLGEEYQERVLFKATPTARMHDSHG